MTTSTSTSTSTSTTPTTPPLMHTPTVQRHLAVLFGADTPYEIRHKTLQGRVLGKVYPPDHHAAAAADLAKLDAQMAACWVTMNSTTLPPGATWRSVLTKDQDTPARRWLVLDLDPVRERDTNSTADELAAAADAADRVMQHLTAAGWPPPLRVLSGNGHHLCYRIDLPADDGGLVDRVLQGLAARFSTDTVTLDRTLHNASRIIKLAGTVARKAPHTAERPQRLAALLQVPDQMQLVTRGMLEQQTAPTVAAPAPRPAERFQPRPGQFDTTPDGVARWLVEHGVPIKRTATKGGDTWHYLAACPLTGVESEGHTDLGVCVSAAGPIRYHNLHNRGVGVTWHKLRQHLDPTYNPAGRSSPTASQAAGGQRQPAPATADVVQELELAVLCAMATYSTADSMQQQVLATISRKLGGRQWHLATLHACLQNALADTDGRRVSSTLLRAHGCTGTDADTLANSDPLPPEHVRAYVDMLADTDRQADAQELAAGIVQRLQTALESTPDRVQLALQNVVPEIERHTDRHTPDVLVRMGADVEHELWQQTTARHGQALQGLDSGMAWLNTATDGLRGMMVLASGPGQGKTALSLQMVRGVLTQQQDVACVFLSFELERGTVYKRMLSALAGVDYRIVAKGGASAQQQDDIDKARGTLRGWLSQRLLLHDARGAGSVNLDTLLGVVQAAKRHAGTDRALVVLDSLQAAQFAPDDDAGFGSDVERDNHTMAVMQRLQAELDDPLVCISEQNKAAMNTDKITSVRGSARLIYRPDFVLLLQKPDSAENPLEGLPDGVTDLRLCVEKARDGGQLGTHKLVHLWRVGQFVPHSDYRLPPRPFGVQGKGRGQ